MPRQLNQDLAGLALRALAFLLPATLLGVAGAVLLNADEVDEQWETVIPAVCVAIALSALIYNALSIKQQLVLLARSACLTEDLLDASSGQAVHQVMDKRAGAFENYKERFDEMKSRLELDRADTSPGTPAEESKWKTEARARRRSQMSQELEESLKNDLEQSGIGALKDLLVEADTLTLQLISNGLPTSASTLRSARHKLTNHLIASPLADEM